MDSITGTTGNDTINGVVTAGADSTLGLADVINGGDGTDVLNVTLSGANLPAATISGVENFFIRDLSGQAASFAAVTGAAQVWTSGSTSNLAVTNLQNNVALGAANTGADLSATFKDGTFVAGSTLTLAANAAGTKATDRTDFTVGHATAAGTATDLTLAVLAAGGSSFINYIEGGKSIGTFSTITASGAGTVDLTAGASLFDGVKTVNVSANTGGVTVDLGATNAKDVTITGGAGNDRFVVANFNGDDVVNGGAGKDTLAISFANAAAFTKAANVTNVEVIELTGATGAAAQVNATFFGSSSFVLDGAVGHNVTLTNVASGGTVQINADSTAVATLQIDVAGAIAGANDSLTLTTDRTGALLNTGTKELSINAGGVEVLNVVSSSAADAGAFTLEQFTSAQLTTINISGNGAVTIDNALPASALATVNASAATAAVTVNASASTVGVTFSGGSKVDTFTGGAKADTFNGSTGADVFTLGGGADVVRYTAANQSTAAATDVITDFVVTADLISFASSLQVGTASYIGAAAFTNTGATQLRMNVNNLEVDFNGDATADMVITLAGVTSAQFGAANFTFA